VLIKPPPGKTLAGDPVAGAASFTKGNGFVPLTEARQIPSGSQIDARRGTLNLTAASSVRHGKLQTGTFGGAIFGFTQASSGLNKGLTTLTLLENDFPGAPSYSTCPKAVADGGPLAHISSVLQTLHARDNHGHFRTRGRYSAGTVRGTSWDTTDQCGGTLTVVHRGTVDVFALVTLHSARGKFKVRGRFTAGTVFG